MCALMAAMGVEGNAMAAPFYEDKADLLVHIGQDGTKQAIHDSSQWEERRAHILENMQAVMGPLPGPEKRIPLDVQVVEETAGPAFVTKKITYAAEPGDRVPAYLLIPNARSGKAPAMLCLHPTSDLGKRQIVGLGDKTNRNYGQELAERGYVCLAPDYPTQGEYAVDAYALGYQSGTMKGIWNHLRAVDLLQSLPEVDGARIGCIGHSLGGHNTLFVGAFDPRIKVMVTSCGFNPFAHYMNGDLTGWCGPRYMPRIETAYGKDPKRMPFDFHEVLGALAPRAVFVSAPLHDDNFLTGADECVAAAKPVYALFGREANLHIVRPDCAHDFPPEVRHQAYAFIDKALKHKLTTLGK
jgi:dienelactone hydrolase